MVVLTGFTWGTFKLLVSETHPRESEAISLWWPRHHPSASTGAWKAQLRLGEREPQLRACFLKPHASSVQSLESFLNFMLPFILVMVRWLRPHSVHPAARPHFPSVGAEAVCLCLSQNLPPCHHLPIQVLGLIVCSFTPQQRLSSKDVSVSWGHRACLETLLVISWGV